MSRAGGADRGEFFLHRWGGVGQKKFFTEREGKFCPSWEQILHKLELNFPS